MSEILLAVAIVIGLGIIVLPFFLVEKMKKETSILLQAFGFFIVINAIIGVISLGN